MLNRTKPFFFLLLIAALGCGGVEKQQNPTPVLNSLSLASVVAGSPGFSLDVIGAGFTPGATVGFGTTTLTASLVSPSRLQVAVPDSLLVDAAVLPVTVSNPAPGGGTSNRMEFTVTNPVPSITQLSLSSALAGTTALVLEITGTSFNSSSRVNFGAVTLTPSATGKTTLTVSIPDSSIATAGLLAVSVFNPSPGGGVSGVMGFTVTNPGPVISAISVSSILAGSDAVTLDIEGSNFVRGTTVDFGATSLTPSAQSATRLTVTVPASLMARAGIVGIRASNPGPGGGKSGAMDFTVFNPLPSLASLSVTSILAGSDGFALEISGDNFVSDTSVQIGGTSFTASSFTKNLLTIAVPASFLSTAAIHAVTVSNPGPGGGKSKALNFTVANQRPGLNSLSYSLSNVIAGGGDFTLTLSGKDFVSGAAVTIGTTPLVPASLDKGKLTVVVPAVTIAAPGNLSVTVENPPPGGGSSNPLSFTVNTEPAKGIWAPVTWDTGVNAATLMPNSTKTFNSYTQPAVNGRGLVVFRAHSKGESEPVRGIYTLDMGAGNKPIQEIASGAMEVPPPNNTPYQDKLASFNEFPSIARIDIGSDTTAFRGQSQPVWTYVLGDGTESRVGSAGIYVHPHSAGSLLTGVGLLGALPDFSYMQVPGASPGTRFDQFPGAPAVTGATIIAFKGNYTEGDSGKTGVFYRDIQAESGKSPVVLIANVNTVIPNQPAGGTVTFGSTSPPSAADGYMVFAGFDNEESPSLGGIYRAPIQPDATLETLVGIGSPVPGESATFNRLGEGVSFDGRFVGFWGAWGEETRPLLLICPSDGNQDMIASCNSMHPNGFETTVPLRQGIFVYDTQTSEIIPIAKTGNNFDDFVYWVFSGRPPGAHGGAGEDIVPEPPRWRSSSFVAVSGKANSLFRTVFKAKIGSVDGLYLRQGGDPSEIQVVLDTTLPGQGLDSQAPAGATITAVGVERDGFRGDWLVLTSSMLDAITGETWGGIYVTHVPQP